MARIRRECKSRQLIEMRNQTCSICKSAPVQFKHFGAYSCNRCRAFFRELSWRYFSPIFQAYLFTSRTNLENLQKRDYFRPILMFRFQHVKLKCGLKLPLLDSFDKTKLEYSSWKSVSLMTSPSFFSQVSSQIDSGGPNFVECRGATVF